MKYIRTKTGIYEVLKDIFKPMENNMVFIPDEGLVKILKQADTIKELCDEFVCPENKMTFHDLETITSSCNLKHLTVYGSIWTDKGLIYVAKMNNKGEFELL